MRKLEFWTRRGLVAALAVLAGSFAVTSLEAQMPAPPLTILLIRHAEKPESGVDLSPAGFARAKVIPQLFSGAGAHDLPRPDFLFATHAGKNSNREVETVVPLSEALGLPVSHDVMDKDYADLAKELLSGKYAGKVVLVCWHHGALPDFARALGVTPPYDKWPDTQFDRVWRIDYRNGAAKLTDLPESLMPGDSK